MSWKNWGNQVGNLLNNERDWDEGSDRAHVSHFRKSRQLLFVLRKDKREGVWKSKYATALKYRNTVVEDGEMLKSRWQLCRANNWVSRALPYTSK